MRPMHTLAFAFCLTAAPFAHAQDATAAHRAKAVEMLELTQTSPMMKEQLNNLQERVNTLAKQQFNPAVLAPAQVKLADEYFKQVEVITADSVGWEKMQPQVVQSYADTFTDAELDGIIAFYKSPAGKAIVTKTPDLANKTMANVQDKIKEMQPKLAQLTEDYQKKIGALASASPAAPASGAAPAAKSRTPAAR